MFASSVFSVMSVNGFPLIIMSAHAQCSMCTCSVEGIPSLVCLHMLSVGTSLISMQCKHWQRWRIFGKDEEKVKNPSSSSKILCLCHKILRLCHKILRLRHKMTELTWLNGNTNWQRWPSLGNVSEGCSIIRVGRLCALSKDSLGSRIRGNVRQRPIRDALDGTINQLWDKR